MSVQLCLLRERTIQARFEAFHAANPQVFDELKRLALQDVREHGARKCAIDLYVNVVRWSHRIRTHGDDFKINNNFRSRYARKLMAEVPELCDKFETRGLQTQ